MCLALKNTSQTQNGQTNIILQLNCPRQAWQHVPVVPAIQEAEAGGPLGPGVQDLPM